MEPQTTDTLPRPRLILTIGNSHIVSPDLDSGVRPVSKFSDDDVSPSTPADDECMSAFDKEGEDEISALSSPTPSNHSHPSSTSATDNLNTTYPQPSDRQVGRPLRNAAAMARARVSSSVQLKRPSPYLKNERSTPVLKTQSRTRARKRDTSAGTPALESMRRRPVDPIGQMIFLQGPVPVMPTVQELKTEGKGTWMSSCERAWRALEGTKGLGLKDGAWKACMAYDENGEAHQPNLTFDLKLRLAIASSPRKKLTLSQIRQVFLERWPYFKGDSKWERTIRHVLTTTHHFCKVPGEEGENIRGNYWTVCTHIPLCKKPDKHVKPFVEFSASSNIPSHAANGTGKMEDLSSDPSSSFALPHPQPGDRMKLETFSSGRKDTPGPSNLLSTPRPASSGERSPNDPCRNTKEWPPSTFTPRSPPGKSWHPQSAFSRSAYRMSYPPPTHHQPRQQSSMATISTLRPYVVNTYTSDLSNSHRRASEGSNQTSWNVYPTPGPSHPVTPLTAPQSLPSWQPIYPHECMRRPVPQYEGRKGSLSADSEPTPAKQAGTRLGAAEQRSVRPELFRSPLSAMEQRRSSIQHLLNP